jgi:hypothetical protein
MQKLIRDELVQVRIRRLKNKASFKLMDRIAGHQLVAGVVYVEDQENHHIGYYESNVDDWRLFDRAVGADGDEHGSSKANAGVQVFRLKLMYIWAG